MPWVRGFFVSRGSNSPGQGVVLRMSAQRSTPRRFKMLTHTEAAAATKPFDTHVIEMLLDLAATDRSNLVNRYDGDERTEKIQRTNEVVAVLGGEMDARRGRMST